MRSRVASILKRAGWLGWLILPFAFFAVFLGYPIIRLFFISLTNKNIALMTEESVGIENYITLLHSPEFILAAIRSFVYTGVCVGASFLGGLLLALLTVSLSTNISAKFSKSFEIIVVLPMLLMPAAASTLWVFSLTEQYGWVNFFLPRLIGLRPRPWLATSYAFYWVMFVDIWSWTPYMYLILLAGAESLPVNTLEAARIDGASRFQSLIYITLPLLKRVMLIALTLKVIDTYKAFDYLWIMTRGGPGTRSTTLNVFLYKTGFQYWDYGLSCAIGVFILLFSVVAIIPFFIIIKKRG